MSQVSCSVFRAARKKGQRGFSLIEIAIAIVVLGLMFQTGISLYRQKLENDRVQQTADTTKLIDQALKDFVARNNRLPCPARPDAALDTADFGREINNGACATDNSVPASTARNNNGAGRWVRIGTVPVRSLNLPDNLIADGWRHRYVYAVTEDFTDAATFTPGGDGAIRLNDSNGNSLTQRAGTAVYALISPGPDARGAYDMSTGRITVQFASSQNQSPGAGGGTNAIAFQNMNGGSDGVTFVATTNKSFGDGANKFTQTMSFMAGSVSETAPPPPGGFSWFVTDYQCVAPICGTGVESGTLKCRDSDGNTVANGNCSGPAPVLTNGNTCTDTCNWVVGAWSACSAACGDGVIERQITCVRDADNSSRPDSDCSAPKPGVAVTNTCTAAIPCYTYAWQTGAYGACSVSACGMTGTQTRAVTCVRNDGVTVADAYCTSAKPSTSQSCSTPACAAPACVALTSAETRGAVVQPLAAGTLQCRLLVMPTSAGQTGAHAIKFTLDNSTTGSPQTFECIVNWDATGWDGSSTLVATATMPTPVGFDEATGNNFCVRASSSLFVRNSEQCADEAYSTACAAAYTYSWFTGAWPACTAACESTANQTRVVECRRNDGVVVADGFCPNPKPATTQVCNGPVPCPSCVPEYTASVPNGTVCRLITGYHTISADTFLISETCSALPGTSITVNPAGLPNEPVTAGKGWQTLFTSNYQQGSVAGMAGAIGEHVSGTCAALGWPGGDPVLANDAYCDLQVDYYMQTDLLTCASSTGTAGCPVLPDCSAGACGQLNATVGQALGHNVFSTNSANNGNDDYLMGGFAPINPPTVTWQAVGNCTAGPTYAWETGAWGVCSNTCGNGTRTRSVVCKRNDGVTVDDSFCAGLKPQASMSCVGNSGCTTCDASIYFAVDTIRTTPAHVTKANALINQLHGDLAGDPRFANKQYGAGRYFVTPNQMALAGANGSTVSEAFTDYGFGFAIPFVDINAFASTAQPACPHMVNPGYCNVGDWTLGGVYHALNVIAGNPSGDGFTPPVSWPANANRKFVIVIGEKEGHQADYISGDVRNELSSIGAHVLSVNTGTMLGDMSNVVAGAGNVFNAAPAGVSYPALSTQIRDRMSVLCAGSPPVACTRYVAEEPIGRYCRREQRDNGIGFDVVVDTCQGATCGVVPCSDFDQTFLETYNGPCSDGNGVCETSYYMWTDGKSCNSSTGVGGCPAFAAGNGGSYGSYTYGDGTTHYPPTPVWTANGAGSCGPLTYDWHVQWGACGPHLSYPAPQQGQAKVITCRSNEGDTVADALCNPATKPAAGHRACPMPASLASCWSCGLGAPDTPPTTTCEWDGATGGDGPSYCNDQYGAINQNGDPTCPGREGDASNPPAVGSNLANIWHSVPMTTCTGGCTARWSVDNPPACSLVCSNTAPQPSYYGPHSVIVRCRDINTNAVLPDASCACDGPKPANTQTCPAVQVPCP